MAPASFPRPILVKSGAFVDRRERAGLRSYLYGLMADIMIKPGISLAGKAFTHHGTATQAESSPGSQKKNGGSPRKQAIGERRSGVRRGLLTWLFFFKKAIFFKLTRSESYSIRHESIAEAPARKRRHEGAEAIHTIPSSSVGRADDC